jgi:regulatory subunit for Cdc7p protein kinase
LCRNNDFLIKAREMGMKVWPMEKLQRMLVTLLETNTGDQVVQNTRTAQAHSKVAREAELSELLRNEKRHTMVDREWLTETVPFRGYYVYVHDMDEKTKPVMIRDYPKAATKEQGKWPQLRVVSANRCPFLDEPAPRRAATEPSRRNAEQGAHRMRAATTVTQTTNQPPNPKRVLTENMNVAGRKQSPSKPLDPPKNIPIKRGSTDQLPFWNSAQAALRKHPRFAQGEPVASGVQPSNITSAIQSQMVSSTAAGPGAKAGSTRELNALKRKVLERNSANGTTDVNYLGNVRAAINDDTSRPNKRKALGNIAEEEPQKVVAPRKKRVVEKECKPGYCENCRDKFDDFDEVSQVIFEKLNITDLLQHVLSRAHRKFALASENWRELDSLLSKLERI